MITYATDSPEPLRAAVNAAVDYVRCFAPTPATPDREPHRGAPPNPNQRDAFRN
jgi:hypothetical protein